MYAPLCHELLNSRKRTLKRYGNTQLRTLKEVMRTLIVLLLTHGLLYR